MDLGRHPVRPSGELGHCPWWLEENLGEENLEKPSSGSMSV